MPHLPVDQLTTQQWEQCVCLKSEENNHKALFISHIPAHRVMRAPQDSSHDVLRSSDEYYLTYSVRWKQYKNKNKENHLVKILSAILNEPDSV